MTAPDAGIALDKLPARREGLPVRVDPYRAQAYAAATNDANPAYEDGSVPPLFPVVMAWDVLMDCLTSVVPADALSRLLHGEHDVQVHDPLRAGEMAASACEVFSLRGARTGTRLTLRMTTLKEGETVVVEQYATMFLRGVVGIDDWGPDKPAHAFPEEARPALLGEVVRRIEPDQATRYAEASGDRNPIHLDEATARAARLPGVVLHGLCTMAMCGSALVESAGGGDPDRLRRLAVRFSWPVFPGQELAVSNYAVGEGAGEFAFEASSGGKVVVRDGRAEFAAAV